MRGRCLAVEEARRGQEEGAGADAGEVCPPLRVRPQPLDRTGVPGNVQRSQGGDQDEVGLRGLSDAQVGGDPQAGARLDRLAVQAGQQDLEQRDLGPSHHPVVQAPGLVKHVQRSGEGGGHGVLESQDHDPFHRLSLSGGIAL